MRKAQHEVCEGLIKIVSQGNNSASVWPNAADFFPFQSEGT